jgi:hypothetical protein
MKLFMLVLSTIFLFSCNIGIIDRSRLDEIPKFYGMSHVLEWIHDTIEYKTDLENYCLPEFYASPERTLYMKSGDCEDRAILFAYIVKIQFNIEIEFSIWKHIDFDSYHLVCYNHGTYYDPTVRRPYEKTASNFIEIERKNYNYYLSKCK